MSSELQTLTFSAQRLWQSLQISTGNLSGSSVSGYRGDSVFTSLLQTASGQATESGSSQELRLQTFPRLTAGNLKYTGRDLDVAIDGNGWLVVEAPDGTEGLTRNGMLRLTSDGSLVTGSGYPVLGEGGVINIPVSSQLNINEKGAISVVPAGSSVLEEVAQIRLVNPPGESISRGSYGLFHFEGALVADEAISLVSKHLEESNVDAISEYLDMLSNGRNLDVHIRLMKSFDDLAREGNDLLMPVSSDSKR